MAISELVAWNHSSKGFLTPRQKEIFAWDELKFAIRLNSTAVQVWKQVHLHIRVLGNSIFVSA